MAEKTRRLYWTSKAGTKYVAEGVPFDAVVMMFGATCPACLEERRNGEVEWMDFTDYTFGHRDRERGKVKHKMPAKLLWVSRDGKALEVEDHEGNVTVYPGRERTEV